MYYRSDIENDPNDSNDEFDAGPQAGVTYYVIDTENYVQETETLNSGTFQHGAYSVSYTHLDVYKRQLHIRGLKTKNLALQCCGIIIKLIDRHIADICIESSHFDFCPTLSLAI